MRDPSADRYELLKTKLKSVSSSDAELRTVNGVGGAFLGTFRDPNLGECYFTRQFLVLAWLPLIPFDVFLVSHPPEDAGRLTRGTYLLHGRMSMRDLKEVYGSEFPLWYWRLSIAKDSWIGIAILATIAFLVTK